MNEIAVSPIVSPARGIDFAEFFDAHRDRLYQALWLVTRDAHEAEEIAQDAFVRLLERWDRVDAIDDLPAYLYRTAMNLWRSRLRRSTLAAKRTVHIQSGKDDMAMVDSNDAVIRALASLPPTQRAVIGLVEMLDMTSEQAGEALGIRASTVRVHLARARHSLRDQATEGTSHAERP